MVLVESMSLGVVRMMPLHTMVGSLYEPYVGVMSGRQEQCTEPRGKDHYQAKPLHIRSSPLGLSYFITI